MSFSTIDFRMFDMPPYLFWALMGIFFSLSTSMFLFKYNGLSVKIYFNIVLMTFPFIMFGAILMGMVYNIVTNLSYNQPITWDTFKYTGIVFYGGLTGFIFSFCILSRIITKKLNAEALDVIAVCIPLFHTFARIGCFTAGCCYGIESHAWYSIHYTNRIKDNIISADRIPTQLLESSVELLLFSVLLILFIKKKRTTELLFLYLTIYAVYRFFAEFLRGDWDRNVFKILSGSQIYSVFILIIIVIFFIKRKVKILHSSKKDSRRE